MSAHASKLAVYAQPAARHGRGGFLSGSLGTSLLIFGGLGLLLLAVDLPEVVRSPQRVAHRIAFHAPTPAPAPVPDIKPVVAEIVPDTRLAQPIDRPATVPVIETPVVAAPDPEPVPTAPAPRRVYGVRKVMARGLGSGSGAGSVGLVTRRGNVLDGVADTLTATAGDLRGDLAALSTVERAPEPVHQVKPRYSEALIAARAGGVVTAKLLVDAEGSVADVVVLEHIGHDSAQLAADAFRQFRFHPALRHGEAVAVWIVYRMRFEFQK